MVHAATETNMKSTSVTAAPRVDDAKEKAIETRIINQLRKELDEQECEIFRQYDKVGKLFKEDSNSKHVNLFSHPEWLDVSKAHHRT